MEEILVKSVKEGTRDGKKVQKSFENSLAF